MILPRCGRSMTMRRRRRSITRPRCWRRRVGLAGLGLGEHGAVELGASEQLVVRPLVDGAAVVQEHDAVGERDGRGPVGDDQRGAALHHLGERGADLVLLRGVDRRRRVVEDQHARIGEHRARDRDALALTTRQREPVLTDHGLVPLGERVDEVGGAREPRGAAHVVHRRTRIGEREVLAHGVGEQERVLEHDADRASQLVQPELAHVDAVDEHAPAVDVVEARHQ